MEVCEPIFGMPPLRKDSGADWLPLGNIFDGSRDEKDKERVWRMVEGMAKDRTNIRFMTMMTMMIIYSQLPAL
jgi:hypothetical protein